MTYMYEEVDEWFHIHVTYESGETRYVCRVEDEKLAQRLVTEFQESVS